MRTLARAATRSLVALCIALALAVVAVAVIGILNTRSAASLGNTIAGDELTTSTVTGRPSAARSPCHPRLRMAHRSGNVGVPSVVRR
jgi:hypothetical protein